MSTHKELNKNKMKISDFKKYKEEGRKFTYVTAYDYTIASIVNDSDVDIIEGTNQEERQYLGEYIDSSMIGTRAISSV